MNQQNSYDQARQHINYEPAQSRSKKWVIIIMSILIICGGVYLWRNQEKQLDISLKNLSNPIVIQNNVSTISLQRGQYVYTLTRENILKSKNYFVEMDNVFGVKSESDEPRIEDAYSAAFSIVPNDDKRAMGALKMFENGNSFTTEIKSKEEGQDIMEDMKYFEKVKFSVAILPANSTVKEISKKNQKRRYYQCFWYSFQARRNRRKWY